MSLRQLAFDRLGVDQLEKRLDEVRVQAHRAGLVDVVLQQVFPAIDLQDGDTVLLLELADWLEDEEDEELEESPAVSTPLQ